MRLARNKMLGNDKRKVFCNATAASLGWLKAFTRSRTWLLGCGQHARTFLGELLNIVLLFELLETAFRA